MKNFAYFFIAISATFLLAPAVQAASAPGNAFATVQQALQVTEDTSMSFGTFSSDGAGTINTSGAATGGVAALGGPYSPGIFAVTGGNNASYTVSGDATVTLDDIGDGEAMTADLTYPAGAQTLDNAGSGTFNVTGVLNVNANQAAGGYTGSYNVNVNY